MIVVITYRPDIDIAINVDPESVADRMHSIPFDTVALSLTQIASGMTVISLA